MHWFTRLYHDWWQTINRLYSVNLAEMSKFTMMFIISISLFGIHETISTCNKDKEKLPTRPYTTLTYQIRKIY